MPACVVADVEHPLDRLEANDGHHVSNLRVAHLDILVHVSSWDADNAHVEEHAIELVEFWNLDVEGFDWVFLYRKQVALSNKVRLHVIIQLVVEIIDNSKTILPLQYS